MREKVSRLCPQTTTFLKRKESRSGIEPRSFRLPTSRLTARPQRLKCSSMTAYPLQSKGDKWCKPESRMTPTTQHVGLADTGGLHMVVGSKESVWGGDMVCLEKRGFRERPWAGARGGGGGQAERHTERHRQTPVSYTHLRAHETA